MKPLGDAFIKLIKMIIAPIIFCTVVHGIASMEDMKKVGRVGLKALLYFEVVTTLALIVGLIVVNTLQPGAGMNIDAGHARHQGDRRAYVAKAKEQSTRRVPAGHHPQHRGRRLRQGRDPAGAVLRRSCSRFGLQTLGERGKPLLDVIDQACARAVRRSSASS